MTAIDFHVNAGDKLAYACRVVRDAYRAGIRVVVHGDDPVLAAFDRLLWTFGATEFVPHCRVRDRLVDATPIHLAGRDDADRCVHHDLLVNLDREAPSYFGRFTRMIEIVAADDDDRDAGRARYRQYRHLGYPLGPTVDVGAAAAPS